MLFRIMDWLYDFRNSSSKVLPSGSLHSIQPFVLPPRTNIAAELGEVKEIETVSLCLFPEIEISPFRAAVCRCSSILVRVTLSTQIDLKAFQHFKVLSIKHTKCSHTISGSIQNICFIEHCLSVVHLIPLGSYDKLDFPIYFFNQWQIVFNDFIPGIDTISTLYRLNSVALVIA